MKTSLTLTALCLSLGWAHAAFADDAAVEAIRAVGGNVLPIAQNDPRLDVTLNLASEDITDEVLVHVAALPDVVWLNLAGTEITDAGLANIAGMATMEKLHLEKTAITDAGLEHLTGLANLQYLNLYGSQVSDAGLAHLHGLSNLKRVFVWQTQVTDEGIAALQAALPECQIIAGLELAPVEPPAEEPAPEGENQ